MSVAIKVVALLCLVAVLPQPSEQGWFDGDTWYSQFPGFWYKDEYMAVDDYLTNRVDSSESMPANMDALVERLSSNKVSRRERRVLIKLTGLKNTEGRCDKASYDILQDNDSATYYKSRDVTTKRYAIVAPRRIEYLINYYANQHALTCQKETEATFHQKYPNVDQQVLHTVSLWLDPIIETILSDFKQRKGQQIGDDFSSKAYHAIIKKFEQHPAIFNVELAYNTLKELVKDNEDDQKYLHYSTDEHTGKRYFSEWKIRLLFTNYLEKACTAYTEELGELFERASFDAIFHHDVNVEDPQFYKAWSYAELCDRIFVDPIKYENRQFFPTGELTKYAKKIADAEEQTKSAE